jgi:hypothetical protein
MSKDDKARVLDEQDFMFSVWEMYEGRKGTPHDNHADNILKTAKALRRQRDHYKDNTLKTAKALRRQRDHYKEIARELMHIIKSYRLRITPTDSARIAELRRRIDGE